MKNKLNLLLGLLAGTAIGTAMGMLFSPHKGSVLRRNIRRKGETIASNVTEDFEERAGQLGNVVSEKLDNVKEELKSRFGSVRDTFSNR